MIRAPAGRYYSSPRPEASLKCYRCKESGHFQFNCTSGPRNGGACFVCGDTSHGAASCAADVCFTCDEPGHRANGCPNRDALLDSVVEHGRAPGYGRFLPMRLGPAAGTERIMPMSWIPHGGAENIANPRIGVHRNAAAFANLIRSGHLPAVDVLGVNFCGCCAGETTTNLGPHVCPSVSEMTLVSCSACGSRGHALCTARAAVPATVVMHAAQLPDGVVLGQDVDIEAHPSVRISRTAPQEAYRGACFNCGSSRHNGWHCTRSKPNGLEQGNTVVGYLGPPPPERKYYPDRSDDGTLLLVTATATAASSTSIPSLKRILPTTSMIATSSSDSDSDREDADDGSSGNDAKIVNTGGQQVKGVKGVVVAGKGVTGVVTSATTTSLLRKGTTTTTSTSTTKKEVIAINNEDGLISFKEFSALVCSAVFSAKGQEIGVSQLASLLTLRPRDQPNGNKTAHKKFGSLCKAVVGVRTILKTVSNGGNHQEPFLIPAAPTTTAAAAGVVKSSEEEGGNKHKRRRLVEEGEIDEAVESGEVVEESSTGRDEEEEDVVVNKEESKKARKARRRAEKERNKVGKIPSTRHPALIGKEKRREWREAAAVKTEKHHQNEENVKKRTEQIDQSQQTRVAAASGKEVKVKNGRKHRERMLKRYQTDQLIMQVGGGGGGDGGKKKQGKNKNQDRSQAKHRDK